MKTTRMLIISVSVLGLLTRAAQLAGAEPMGTAFTYQGQLYDVGYPANGKYDLAFKLYDANAGGNKVGTDVNVADVNVIDGYFTVKLDFGDVFDGNALWLRTGVRPGVQDDPCVYTLLNPRQEVTPTPYAIYTKTAGVPSGVIVMWSGSTTNIPSGWVLCNGDNDTPDLRDRFVYGISAEQNPGVTGGTISHFHTYSDVPQHTHSASCNTSGAHSHTYYDASHQDSGPAGWIGGNWLGTSSQTTSLSEEHSHSITIDPTGSAICSTDGAANLPPYYKIAFIMKL